MEKKIWNFVNEGITLQLGSVIITREKLIKEDLGLPSIKLVMLLTDITSKLDINIMDFSDYELLRIKTVGDLIDLLIIKKTENENI